MRVAIAAGGTGGHIFPALSLAQAIRELGAKPIFLGRSSGLEVQLVSRAGFPFYSIKASGLMGRGFRGAVRFALTLLEGFLGSIAILSKVRAQRLVLTGSYLGLAPALAAISLRIPYFLLEFNRIAGRVNRYLAPYAYEVELGVPLAYPIRGRSILTGVPLRPELSSLKRKDDGRTVIFLGGSQGASVLNWASLEVARARPELRFLVLAGDRDYPALIRAQRPQNLQIFPFLPDPTPLYQLASLAVSRAGGIAIAELASSGIPMILVPFPYASDDHQTANARWIERKGAGVMLEQGRLKELAKLVGELIGDSQRLKEMSARACVIFDRNGARLIAERVLKC